MVRRAWASAIRGPPYRVGKAAPGSRLASTRVGTTRVMAQWQAQNRTRRSGKNQNGRKEKSGADKSNYVNLQLTVTLQKSVRY